MARKPEAPRLLERDHEELDQAAALIKEGGPLFLVVVCAPALRKAALDYLNDKELDRRIDAPLSLTAAEHVPTVLTATPPGGALSLAFDAANREVATAINWHREKLRREGAITLLWLADGDALRHFHEAAPDAYAFRDFIVMLYGSVAAIPGVRVEEALGLQRARRRAARTTDDKEHLRALVDLVETLRGTGRLDEATQYAKKAEMLLADTPIKDHENHDLRNKLAWYQAAVAADGDRLVDAWRLNRTAIAMLSDCASGECALDRLKLIVGGFGAPTLFSDRRDLLAASESLHGIEVNPAIRRSAIERLAVTESARGNSLRARELIAQARVREQNAFTKGVVESRIAVIDSHAGNLIAAERHLREAIAAFASMGSREHLQPKLEDLARCYIERGELRSAMDVLTEWEHSSILSRTDGRPRSAIAALRLAEGDGRMALRELLDGLEAATQRVGDLAICSLTLELVINTAELDDAVGLDDPDWRSIDEHLNEADRALRRIAAGDPPWYEILGPEWRARALALRPARRVEAIVLLREAQQKGLGLMPELAVAPGRGLIEALLDNGEVDEAAALLEEVSREAAEHAMGGETARCAALAVRCATMTGASRDELDQRLRDLREALRRSGSIRLAADVLLDLAKHLPPDTRHPDSIALLNEAHQHYLDMPKPAGEARVLELAGDILAARGQTAVARRRYLAAQKKLQRHGLKLRLPILAARLAALDAPASKT